MGDVEDGEGFINVPLDELGKPQLAQDEGTFFAQQTDEDIRKKRLVNDGMQQDNAQRLDYAEKAYGLVQAWVGFVIVIIIAQFSLKPLGYGLSEAEFIAVVVTLSGSVLGFWLLVGRYLFPSKSDKADE